MIEIGERLIGFGRKPVISAEISLNHNGSLSKALEMIGAAADAGADAVKLQYFKTTDFQKNKKEETTYQQAYWDEPDRKYYGLHEVTETVYGLFKRHEIDIDFVKGCRDLAWDRGLIFGVTPTSYKGVNDLAELGIDYFKIASDMTAKTKMVETMKVHGDIPIICSLGHLALHEPGPEAAMFLHCVSEYPAKNPRLWKMTHMMAGGFPVGYSDHCEGIEASVRATELGACWIEKHFTLDKTMPGPDHWWSGDPVEFKLLREAIG